MAEDIRVGALTIRFLVDGEQSNGTQAVFEVTIPPEAHVPAPHSHDGFEETVYGLDGVSTWTVDGTEHAIAPGDTVCILRGAVHGFVNRGDVPARALCVVSPAGFGPGFFRAMGEAVPDPQRIAEVMRRHGLTPAPPS